MSRLLKNYAVSGDISYHLREIEPDRAPRVSAQRPALKQVPRAPQKESADETAAKLIAEAKRAAEAEARSIIDEMVARAEREIEAKKSEGYRDGLKAGKEAAAGEVAGMMREFGELIAQLDDLKAEAVKSWECDLKDLAVGIARKVIEVEIDTDSSAFMNIYRNSIKDISNQEWLKISVSAKDSIFATRNADLLMSMVKGAKYVEIAKIDDAPAGTCIVETEKGIVDASVATQLDKIRGALTAAEA